MSHERNIGVEHRKQILDRFLVIGWRIVGRIWLFVQIRRREQSLSVQVVDLVTWNEELDKSRVVAKAAHGIVRAKPVVDNIALVVEESVSNTNWSVVIDLVCPIL